MWSKLALSRPPRPTKIKHNIPALPLPPPSPANKPPSPGVPNLAAGLVRRILAS
ncbi:hypothetical protein IMZ48_15970 [Candidatus Bathyarchaeota archaeon]|nr:hypothetical protein [Candidatus Bathyarchaeota archaeon]